MATSASASAFEQPPHRFVGPVLADLPVAARYAAAVLLIVAVAVARDALTPLIGGHAPFLPFGFAVFAAAYLGGIGPAVLATVTAAVIASALYADTSGRAELLGWTAHTTLFVLLGCLVAALTHRLQLVYRAQCATLAAARAAEDRLKTLTDAMPALIAYVDKDHRYVFNNRAYCD